LFGDPTPNNSRMIESENNDIPKLYDDENGILTVTFIEK
jgi:hypothetical protein